MSPWPRFFGPPCRFRCIPTCRLMITVMMQTYATYHRKVYNVLFRAQSKIDRSNGFPVPQSILNFTVRDFERAIPVSLSATISCTLLTKKGACSTLWRTQNIHRVSKKQDTKLLPITSPNVNRFSKFFNWQTHW